MKLLKLTKRMLSGNFKVNIDRRKKLYPISEEEQMAKKIVIASLWKEEDELSDEQFKHLMKIPKTWILKRIDLSDLLEDKK